MEVPPHGTAVVTFKLVVYRPEPFADRRALYLDDGNLRVVELSVRGVGVRNGRPAVSGEGE